MPIVSDRLRPYIGGNDQSSRGRTCHVQSGYLYWYALVMILGVMGLMTWQLWPYIKPQFNALFGF